MNADLPAASQPTHTNRLTKATSPYLQQHAHNPVDWYEWGPEALDKARNENKPIFLSIGYSACHWCHVMAHESFEDERIAALMNKYFVNVKVDREERPDLDDIYMQATIVFTRGQGGWPMSVWLTPELKPFAAGTYFPPTSRWGRAGFGDICQQIGEAWQTRRPDVEADAQRLTDYLAERSGSDDPTSAPVLTLETVDRVADLLARAFDATQGGLVSGGSNKFPPSMAMDLLLRSARRSTDPAQRRLLEERVFVTLERMAAGGIYDQLAGGIARYSTDLEWLVPHFEKMLFDQALVSRIYLDAFQYSHNPLHARIAAEICDYVIADLQAPEGGFYSTRDADSEGQEGKYYVWTRAEIVAELGSAEGELFCSYYDVSDTGNWSDPHEPGVSKNILHTPHELTAVAKRSGVEPTALQQRLAAGRAKLLEARARRIPPHRDEKILCEWNGLMIASLARAGCVLDQPRYTAAARKAADFVLTHQYRNGRLQRSFRDGRTLDAAFLADYSGMIDGLLELYEATFERRWLDAAIELNDVVIANYWDEQRGGFFTTPHNHETLIVRPKDARDSAVPSGNSIQLMNLLRLAVILGDKRLQELAERTIAVFASDVAEAPGASERFMAGVEFARLGPVEIAIIGDRAELRTKALLKQVYATYLPNRVIMLLEPTGPTDAPKSPLLADRPQVDGRPTAYVCRNYTCKLPVTTPEALAEQLR